MTVYFLQRYIKGVGNTMEAEKAISATINCGPQSAGVEISLVGFHTIYLAHVLLVIRASTWLIHSQQ